MSSSSIWLTALLASATVGVCAQVVVHEATPSRTVRVVAVHADGETHGALPFAVPATRVLRVDAGSGDVTQTQTLVIYLATFISHMGISGPAGIASALQSAIC